MSEHEERKRWKRFKSIDQQNDKYRLKKYLATTTDWMFHFVNTLEKKKKKYTIGKEWSKFAKQLNCAQKEINIKEKASETTINELKKKNKD